MSFVSIDPGNNTPEEFNVVIEIPCYGEPVKYEIDKKSGTMFVDRFLATSMRYPCNYGFIPQTLSEDGDPVDVLVIAPFPIISGAIITSRAIGMLRMTDEKGVDVKVLAVPIDKLTPGYQHIHTYENIPQAELATIAHFFEHYKDLEPNKWVKIDGWVGPAEAKLEIINCVERYQTQK